MSVSACGRSTVATEKTEEEHEAISRFLDCLLGGVRAYVTEDTAEENWAVIEECALGFRRQMRLFTNPDVSSMLPSLSMKRSEDTEDRVQRKSRLVNPEIDLVGYQDQNQKRCHLAHFPIWKEGKGDTYGDAHLVIHFYYKTTDTFHFYNPQHILTIGSCISTPTTPPPPPQPNMPSKQVRFAYKNTFHSPPPVDTPQLSFSSSLPSNSGPVTPPSVSQPLPPVHSYGIPYASSKSKSSSYYSESVRAHPYLENGGVNYDVMDHYSMALSARSHRPLSSRTCREPATYPPLAFLVITSPYLPWKIKVYPANGSYVTVEDVLASIYRSLRTNITGQDFTALSNPNDQRRATRAYENRYRRLRDPRAYDEEKRSGMKRVDFLLGHTRFLSISNSGKRVDEWYLNIT
ncbi:hypothetical protein CVT24_011859 [Panaeolus cyanescens]|uniref:DUF6699 domain-containing protein n=1 Tax=Panaeolus cyanescens TaxID=181874 RepID=A0A409YNK1_9AGAR|nr:hypothetical protein CVT24_011859 [Panaeolus cyanescens]